ncbi:hypothetical protein [Halobacterium rubrum]|uniref:hypothetical protein n=1 Tax=Halobacterium TaxID=2239 RepID=UPI001F3B3963|nr:MULTISPECIES: hypothetical protein [Halobacterium]MDH5019624.1 hypothetical protein [Halobacterium rubrum]
MAASATTPAPASPSRPPSTPPAPTSSTSASSSCRRGTATTATPATLQSSGSTFADGAFAEDDLEERTRRLGEQAVAYAGVEQYPDLAAPAGDDQPVAATQN